MFHHCADEINPINRFAPGPRFAPASPTCVTTETCHKWKVISRSSIFRYKEGLLYITLANKGESELSDNRGRALSIPYKNIDTLCIRDSLSSVLNTSPWQSFVLQQVIILSLTTLLNRVSFLSFAERSGLGPIKVRYQELEFHRRHGTYVFLSCDLVSCKILKNSLFPS
jgi:hypothetical protein